MFRSFLTAQISPLSLCAGHPSNPPSINTSLKGWNPCEYWDTYSVFFFDAYNVNVYDCPGLELRWEILRADGETELYTVVNETYHNGRYEFYPESGLDIDGYCYDDYSDYNGDYYRYSCHAYAAILPTDLRYDGAQITAVLDLPECFNSPNSSGVMTFNIQGHFKHLHYVPQVYIYIFVA